MYSLALMDDHQVVLESFANLLQTAGTFQVAGMATGEPALLEVLAQQPVDVLVTDLIVPGVDVLRLIGVVKSQYPALSVLILSGSVDPAQVRQALKAGANGYVTKTADKAELFDAIMAVAAGRQYIDSRIFTALESPSETADDDLLTERESQIAGLILEELSSAQIAERLFISFNTVETHRKRIYQKLGVTTALGLMKHPFSRKLMKW